MTCDVASGEWERVAAGHGGRPQEVKWRLAAGGTGLGARAFRRCGTKRTATGKTVKEEAKSLQLARRRWWGWRLW